jgi:HSP20 family protein
MGFDLQKWNPFKFARPAAQARPAGAASQEPPQPEWPEAARLLQSIDPFNLMPGIFRSPLAAGTSGGRWFGNYSPGLFQPRIDVVDDGDALRISAEMPGMDKQDLELIVEDGFLVMRGEKRVDAKKDEKGCYRLERAFGSFERVVPLPEGVDLEHAEARFADGVLTLRLPKQPSGGDASRKLQIQ